MMEVQENLQTSVLNVEHNLLNVQQQLQSVVEQLQQYNKNKSSLGDGLTATMDKGSNSRAAIHNPFKQERGSIFRQEHHSSQSKGTYNVLNRPEFPYFDGENGRCWVRRCSRYFELIPIPEDQKVSMASMASIFMQGKSEL